MWTFKKKFFNLLYIIFAKELPISRRCIIFKKIRAYFAKKIMKKTGININIEKGAKINPAISIGNDSGIGIDCELYGEVVIGNNVLMGPECVFYTSNHECHDKNKLIGEQGQTVEEKIIIEDDVWIGRRVIVLPGVKISRGMVVGAGSVLTKNFPEYSIVAGNPCKIIGMRGEESEKK